MSLTTQTTEMSSDYDAVQTDTTKGLCSDSSPLGSYYRWLLCDPTHKDYWAARTTDRATRTEYRDKEAD